MESGQFPARVDGISEFGAKVATGSPVTIPHLLQVVLEMNRLGMLVDLSHVSSDAMRQVR